MADQKTTAVADYFWQLIHRVERHKTALLLMGASVVLSVSDMVAGVFQVRWLDPAEIGLWQSVRLVLTYSMFILLGVNNGLSRELPFEMGKDDLQTSRRLAGTALLFTLSASVIALAGGIVTAFYLSNHNGKVALAVATVTLVIGVTFYSNYLIVTFRSAKSFLALAKTKLISGLLALLTLPLLYYFSYRGLLLRVVVLAGLGLLLMHLLRPINVKPSWDSASFFRLLRTGLPIFSMDYLVTSAATADRLTLLHQGGVEAVGIFALAVIVREAMAVVPKSLNEYVYPRMSHSYGRDGDARRLWHMGINASCLSVAILLVGAGVGWFVLPVLVENLFPKYGDGVPAARIMLIAAVFSGATIGRNALWSMKKWKLMTAYQVMAAGLAIVGPMIGVLCFDSAILGVSVGYLCSQVLLCPAAWGLTYLATHSK